MPHWPALALFAAVYLIPLSALGVLIWFFGGFQ